MPVRKERVRPWFGATGVELGVDDRGVARDEVDEEVVELGSRPVTGGFLAATVDMIEQAMCVGVVSMFAEHQPRGRRKTKTREGK